MERRLAAILFTDMVGYSRLIGLDEEGTIARQKAHREEIIDREITAHGGRIVKTTGDGLLVEFPSVVEAVHCAVEVQEAMATTEIDVPVERRISYRIGINLGDIVIDGDDILGDGVNVTARLEGLAKPGGICISGSVYDQLVGKTDIFFEDAGEQTVKNVPRPVRVWHWKTDAAKEVRPAPALLDKSYIDELLARPALAVLPLINMSEDAEQEYFADGLTEDIITALSKWRSFPVIARNSTFAYKGRSADVRTVATELNARYVLEGSIRKDGERLRISSQLIDAMTGHHVWAERFDRTIEGMFDLQDEITQRIAATVAPELERAERRRVVSHTPNPSAWDLYHRGMSYLYEGTRDANAKARKFFKRAIDADSSYCIAYAQLARSYHDEVGIWAVSNREEMLAKSLAAAQRSVELDDTDSFAHTMLGNTLMRMAQPELGIAQCRLAIVLNPSNSLAYIILGNALGYAGQSEDGIPCIQNGRRLNPQDPHASYFTSMLARVLLTARRHKEAVECASESINLRSSWPFAYIVLASALGHLGRVTEAWSAIEQCERLEPGRITTEFNVMRLMHHNRDDAEHILDGLRKAGWNE